MIIISQNRDEIVNFDNIASLWISLPQENGYREFAIQVGGDIDTDLGYYKTEERAKEVLQDIARAYSDESDYFIYEIPKV